MNAKNRPLNEIRLTHVSSIFPPCHRIARSAAGAAPAALLAMSYRQERVSDRPERCYNCTSAQLAHVWLLQVTIHANPVADAQIAGR